jgi:hypothetical protein
VQQILDIAISGALSSMCTMLCSYDSTKDRTGPRFKNTWLEGVLAGVYSILDTAVRFCKNQHGEMSLKLLIDINKGITGIQSLEAHCDQNIHEWYRLQAKSLFAEYAKLYTNAYLCSTCAARTTTNDELFGGFPETADDCSDSILPEAADEQEP